MTSVGAGQPRPWQAHTPNVLTGLRLVFACAFFGVLSFWRYADSPVLLGARIDPWLLCATGLFVIAAITDALDGYLARRWNAVSVFGRIMDPFADKLLVIGAFAFMASPAFWVPATGSRPGVQVSGVTAWMVAVVLGRELLVTSIRGAMEGAGVSFAASWSGKLKMILQSMIIPSVLLVLSVRAVTPGSPGSVAGNIPLTKGISIAMWITVLVTAWSGIPYVLRAITAAKSPKPGAAA